MSGSERHADDESAAFADRALYANRSAVKFNQLLHQGQADTAAFVSAAATVFDAMKAVE